MKFVMIFLAGYLIRHLIGIAFARLKKGKQKPFDGAENLVDLSKVSKVIVSFDGGKEFYQREKTGWSKVSPDYILSLLKKPL